MTKHQAWAIRSYYVKQEKLGNRPPITLPKLKFMEDKKDVGLQQTESKEAQKLIAHRNNPR